MGLLVMGLIFPLGERLWNASYGTGIALIVCIGVYALCEFNKRVNLRALLEKVRQKNGWK